METKALYHLSTPKPELLHTAMHITPPPCTACGASTVFQGTAIDTDRHAMVSQWACPHGH